MGCCGLINSCLTPWSRDLLGKRTGPRLVKPRILWKPKVHYHIYKCPPPVPMPDQSSLCPSFYLLKIHFNIISHLRVGLPSGLLPLGLLTKMLYVHYPHGRYMPRQFNSIRFDHPNNFFVITHHTDVFIFSTPHLPHTYQIQISSSANCQYPQL